jgi:hypothetical protein
VSGRTRNGRHGGTGVDADRLVADRLDADRYTYRLAGDEEDQSIESDGRDAPA